MIVNTLPANNSRNCPFWSCPSGTDFISYSELQTHMDDAHPDTFVHCLKLSKSLYFIYDIFLWLEDRYHRKERSALETLGFNALCHNKSTQVLCDLQSLSRSWTWNQQRRNQTLCFLQSDAEQPRRTGSTDKGRYDETTSCSHPEVGRHAPEASFSTQGRDRIWAGVSSDGWRVSRYSPNF